jgi:hypothetical protein
MSAIAAPDAPGHVTLGVGSPAMGGGEPPLAPVGSDVAVRAALAGPIPVGTSAAAQALARNATAASAATVLIVSSTSRRPTLLRA